MTDAVITSRCLQQRAVDTFACESSPVSSMCSHLHTGHMEKNDHISQQLTSGSLRNEVRHGQECPIVRRARRTRVLIRVRAAHPHLECLVGSWHKTGAKSKMGCSIAWQGEEWFPYACQSWRKCQQSSFSRHDCIQKYFNGTIIITTLNESLHPGYLCSNDLMLSFKLYPHEVKEQHVTVKYKSVSSAAAELSPLMLFWPVFVVMCRFDKSYIHDH